MNIGGNQLALMEILETIRTEAIDRGCEKKGKSYYNTTCKEGWMNPNGNFQSAVVMRML